MTPARDEARAAATAALMAALVEGRPWDRRVAADPDWDGSLRVLELVLGLRWTEAARCASRLPGVPPDDDAGHWLRRAVTLWAEAGDPGPAAPLAAGLDDGPVADTEPGRFAAHLLVEAVLAHARLDLASALVDRYADALVEPHPFGALAVACRARVLAFRGDIAAADRVLAALGDVPHRRLSAVVSGTFALVRGNDAAPAEVRRAVAEVDVRCPSPATTWPAVRPCSRRSARSRWARSRPPPAGCSSPVATRACPGSASRPARSGSRSWSRWRSPRRTWTPPRPGPTGWPHSWCQRSPTPRPRGR